METWPTLLPDVSETEYGFETDFNLTRSPGNTKTRQVQHYHVEYKVLPARWCFTEFQFALFQSFVTHKIAGGADHFLMDLDFGGGMVEVIARIMDGAYQSSYSDGKWIVTAQLEVDNPPTAEP